MRPIRDSFWTLAVANYSLPANDSCLASQSSPQTQRIERYLTRDAISYPGRPRRRLWSNLPDHAVAGAAAGARERGEQVATARNAGKGKTRRHSRRGNRRIGIRLGTLQGRLSCVNRSAAAAPAAATGPSATATRVNITDGTEQTCAFDENLYFNAGPARLPSSTRHAEYCHELGVPLEVEINTSRIVTSAE